MPMIEQHRCEFFLVLFVESLSLPFTLTDDIEQIRREKLIMLTKAITRG